MQDEEQHHKHLIGGDYNTYTDQLTKAMRMNLKEKIFDEKLKINMELIRRKLDFEVIKDNYENKVTQEILNRYADTDAGLPGTTFKYQKIQELVKERKEAIA